MSDVQVRPPSAPRGRGSAIRGGRGGSSRGGRSGRSGNAPNGDSSAAFDDNSEAGQLKKQWPGEVDMLVSMFPDLTVHEICFAIRDHKGNIQDAANSLVDVKWEEVGSTKNRSKSKAPAEKPVATNRDSSDFNARPSRGGRDGPRGRGRGGFESRGGRGARGGRGGHANGSVRQAKEKTAEETTTTAAGDDWSKAAAAPAETEEIGTWGADVAPPEEESSTGGAWGTNKPAAKPAKKEAPKPAPAPTPAAPAAKTSWASLLQPVKPAPPPPAPVQAKPLPVPEPEPEPIVEKEEPKEPEPEPIAELPANEESEAIPEPEQEIEPVKEAAEPETAEETLAQDHPPLTEDNLDKVEDAAPPAPTGTAASTVATEATPAATPAPKVQVATPLKPSPKPVTKPTPRRKPQEEGVVMPGQHHKIASRLRFGSMGEDDDDQAEEQPSPPQVQETIHESPQVAPEPVVSSPAPPTGPSQMAPIQQPSPIEQQPTPRHAPGLTQQLPSHQQHEDMRQPPVAPQAQQAHAQHGQHPMQVQHQQQFGGYGSGRYDQIPQMPQKMEPFSQHPLYQPPTAPQQHSLHQPPQQPQAQPTQALPFSGSNYYNMSGMTSGPETSGYYDRPPGIAGLPGFQASPYAERTPSALGGQSEHHTGATAHTPSQMHTPSSLPAPIQQLPGRGYNDLSQQSQGTHSPAMPNASLSQSQSQAQYPFPNGHGQFGSGPRGYDKGVNQNMYTSNWVGSPNYPNGYYNAAAHEQAQHAQRSFYGGHPSHIEMYGSQAPSDSRGHPSYYRTQVESPHYSSSPAQGQPGQQDDALKGYGENKAPPVGPAASASSLPVRPGSTSNNPNGPPQQHMFQQPQQQYRYQSFNNQAGQWGNSNYQY